MSQQSPNLKLIAVFAVPLLLVTALLQASKRYVDVFEGDENLDELVKQAKAAGYPFEASELAVKGVPDSNNGFIPLKKYFLDKKNPLPKKTDDIQNYWELDKPTLSPEIAELVRRAKAVGSRSQFDAKRDYDQGFALLFPEYAYLKTVGRVLAYDAAHRARHGDDEGAIQSLRLARNSALQLSADKPLMGVLANLACQSIFYWGVGNVAHEMRGRPASLQKLFLLVNEEIPTSEIQDSIKCEFYLLLAWMRNANPKEMLGVGGESSESDVFGLSMYDLNTSTPLVRTGLPKSTVSQSLLAKAIEKFLKNEAEGASDPNKADSESSLDRDYYTSLLRFSERFVDQIPAAYPEAARARLKPAAWREFARWAIQIAIDHPNGYPKTLPSRKDPSMGGTLHYRKMGNYYALYSTGPDKIDNGGPWIAAGESNPDEGDDFGFSIPVKPKAPIKSTASGVPPKSAPATPGGI
ncbi:MAG TPA: hypothetical protein VK171_02495 [Fimbriimonas sp.]|nr:hypothetical protein [Fimbriimonas sp.]